MVLEMAVTSYPSNVLLLKRGQEEMSTPDCRVLDESAAMLFSNGGNVNLPRKRRKEVYDATVNVNDISLFSLQSLPPLIPPYEIINLDQLQTLYPSPVSTGLHLAFGEPIMNQNVNQWSSIMSSSSSTLMSDDFTIQINQYKDEIDQLICAQGEQLRQTLVDRQQKYCRSLLIAVEESTSKILKLKDGELERAARLTLELENRLTRTKAESVAWQAKAMAEQSKAFALHTQLQQANAVVESAQENCCQETPAEDAESAHIDPGRPENVASKACRVCQKREVSMLILPCQHLCVCEECNVDEILKTCPICHCAIRGRVKVFLC